MSCDEGVVLVDHDVDRDADQDLREDVEDLVQDRQDRRPDHPGAVAARCTATGARGGRRSPPARCHRSVGDRRTVAEKPGWRDGCEDGRTLRVNPTALAITIAYSVVVVVAVVAILIVWRSTHSLERNRRDTTDTHRLAEGEKGWFIFAVVGLAVLLLSTLAFIPYGDNAKADGQQQVQVELAAVRVDRHAQHDPGRRPRPLRRHQRGRQPRVRRLQRRERPAVPDPGGARRPPATSSTRSSGPAGTRWCASSSAA